MERATVDVYERRALAYRQLRPPRHLDRAVELAGRCVPGLPVVDLGCGPGGYLDTLAAHLPSPGAPVVALDAAGAMLDLAAANVAVRADLEALPFRDRVLGGAWARNSYLHVPAVRLPLALARLQWALAPGAPLRVSILAGTGEGPLNDDDIPGRYFALWEGQKLADVVTGAGFDVQALDLIANEHKAGGHGIQSEGTQSEGTWWVAARRARSLPDTVGPGMRLLVCGLNPSEVAADAGFGYAGATNRFWPAALRAGLVTRPRDPLHALVADRVGMTDLVKRATRAAAEISNREYCDGIARLRRLVEWLRPAAVVFVGLAGWRAAVDRRAQPGAQPDGDLACPVYVMPSTSGLNARVSIDELTDHLSRAAALADTALVTRGGRARR